MTRNMLVEPSVMITFRNLIKAYDQPEAELETLKLSGEEIREKSKKWIKQESQ